MLKEPLTTSRKSAYSSPSTTIICIGQMMTVCASNGVTQKYDLQSVWDEFDENE